MLPDEPTDEERLEALPEDNETPFRPAGPAPAEATTSGDSSADDNKLPDDHPATDTNIQPEELYDEGVSGAAEASEPNVNNTVIGYTSPSNDIDNDSA